MSAILNILMPGHGLPQYSSLSGTNFAAKCLWSVDYIPADDEVVCEPMKGE